MIENMPLEGDSHKKERGFSTENLFTKGGKDPFDVMALHASLKKESPAYIVL